VRVKHAQRGQTRIPGAGRPRRRGARRSRGARDRLGQADLDADGPADHRVRAIAWVGPTSTPTGPLITGCVRSPGSGRARRRGARRSQGVCVRLGRVVLDAEVPADHRVRAIAWAGRPRRRRATEHEIRAIASSSSISLRASAAAASLRSDETVARFMTSARAPWSTSRARRPPRRRRGAHRSRGTCDRPVLSISSRCPGRHRHPRLRCVVAKR
jgi:hypothetical protein